MLALAQVVGWAGGVMKSSIYTRADQMVRRGEARDFSHACSILARRRPKTSDKFKRAAAQVAANPKRLPYAE